jgi:hypothetical protein
MQRGGNRDSGRHAKKDMETQRNETQRDAGGADAAAPHRAAASASAQRRGKASRKRPLDAREASLQRRLAAAGLDGPAPQDREEIGRRVLRKLHMVANRWHGCREGLCRRHSGCMAPNLVCSNWPELTKEEEEKLAREWPRTGGSAAKAAQGPARRARGGGQAVRCGRRKKSRRCEPAAAPRAADRCHQYS